MNTDRLHLPRIHGQVHWLKIGFWLTYVCGIIITAKVILSHV